MQGRAAASCDRVGHDVTVVVTAGVVNRSAAADCARSGRARRRRGSCHRASAGDRMSSTFQPGARAWLRAAMFVGLGQQAWAGASFLAGPLLTADGGDFRLVRAATMVAC